MQPTNRPVNAVELRDVTKTFGKVVANDHVSLDIRKGEILSLLGENGSGKTTLMNMLAGIYFPDSGQILVDGKEVSIRSPKDLFQIFVRDTIQNFTLVRRNYGTAYSAECHEHFCGHDSILDFYGLFADYVSGFSGRLTGRY